MRVFALFSGWTWCATTRKFICKICSPLRLLREHQGAPLRVCAKSTFPAHRCDMHHAHKETIVKIPTPDNLTNPFWYEPFPSAHCKPRRRFVRWRGRRSGGLGETPSAFFGSFLSRERNEHKKRNNYRLPQSIFRPAANSPLTLLLHSSRR